MKDDLPYFTHDNDARNHAKMKALRARYGWTGYGQFWALNEMIAGASKARLDLSRKVVRAAAACELGMTTDALDDFLKFLADPDECGLVNYEGGVVTTDRTQEDYGRTESGRNHSRERYEAKKKPLSEKKPIIAQETPILARETIENRIEENRIENTIQPAPSDILRETVTAQTSANAVVKKPVDPLYQAIWQSFKAKTPIMANYAAQGAATHRLVAFIRQHSDKDDPGSAPEFAKRIVTKYWTMTQGRDKFWSKQPFTPINLAAAGILDRVIQELRTAEKQQEPDGFIPF